MPGGKLQTKYLYKTTQAVATMKRRQITANIGMSSRKKNSVHKTLKNMCKKYKIKFIFRSFDLISLSRHIKNVETPIATYIIDHTIGNKISGGDAGGIS